ASFGSAAVSAFAVGAEDVVLTAPAAGASFAPVETEASGLAASLAWLFSSLAPADAATPSLPAAAGGPSWAVWSAAASDAASLEAVSAAADALKPPSSEDCDEPGASAPASGAEVSASSATEDSSPSISASSALSSTSLAVAAVVA